MTHVYPENDFLPHATDGGYCPCEPTIKDGVMYHNSWEGGGKDSPQIIVVKDGNAWMALAGRDLAVGFAGFGDTPQEALKALATTDHLSRICRPLEANG